MDNAVIFDMDGVLVDSTEAHYQAWLEVAGEEGDAVSRELFLRTIGTSNDVTIAILFGDQTPERVADLAERKERRYREMVMEHVTVIDGAVELVHRLSDDGWLLGLGTSAPLGNLECIMTAFPAADRLQVKVHADLVPTGKPEPHIFRMAGEMLGVLPDRCLVIEDSLAGLEAARRAGMTGIGLTTTLLRDQLAEKAALVVDSLRELTPEVMAGLLEKGTKEEPCWTPR